MLRFYQLCWLEMWIFAESIIQHTIHKKMVLNFFLCTFYHLKIWVGMTLLTVTFLGRLYFLILFLLIPRRWKITPTWLKKFFLSLQKVQVFMSLYFLVWLYFIIFFSFWSNFKFKLISIIRRYRKSKRSHTLYLA